MRITNKIMQNNTLYNINNNKVMQDELYTQMTTGQKVTKPSDDPVVAIRSLRLRSNLNQVSQYYGKNVPDAENWLELTESSVSTTVDVITEMVGYFQKGSKSSLTTSDRNAILEGLRQGRAEVYATGDADYAGRTIFAGYRTDMKLSFQADMKESYSINEQLSPAALDTFTYVNLEDVKELGAGTYDTSATTSQDIGSFQVRRLRLAYDKLDEGVAPTINVATGYDADGNIEYSTVGTATAVSLNGTTDPYRMVSDPTYAGYDENAFIFVPETGEILLGEKAFESLNALSADSEIMINYTKTEWNKGDLRPEHYFACTDEEGIEYNSEYLTKDGKTEKQSIKYDVGFNQKLEVNTTADEVFIHGVGRTVDEMIRLLENMQEVDKSVAELEKMVGDSSYDQDAVNTKLEAAKKAQTYLSDTLEKRFEHGITEMQGYLDTANLALTTIGNRGMRLDLISNRLSAQEASFTSLSSKNDEADIAELAVKLSSAGLTYDASLAATGKLLKTTLLNYL